MRSLRTLDVGSDCSIRIERNRNGFEVSETDPEIAKQNDDSGSCTAKPWKSPYTEYQFEDKAQTLAFVEKVFDKALPDPVEQYGRAFDDAAKEAKKKS